MAVPESWRIWPPPRESVVAAIDGDESALHALIVAGMPKLLAFFRGNGFSTHDSEDLAADTAEAVVRSITRLREPDRFEPWFWRIARSKFYDHLRRKRQPPPISDRDVSFADPVDAVVLSDEHRSVRNAFARLKPRERELLWMRDVIGLEYAEIARRLPLQEGAIRIAVMRARRRLVEVLALESQGE